MREEELISLVRKVQSRQTEFQTIEDRRTQFKVVFRNGRAIDKEEIDRTDLHRAVVQFCATPRTREEITEFVGKSRYFTMSAYVQPLLEQGKLRMTIPDKPKSPKQTYVAIT